MTVKLTIERLKDSNVYSLSLPKWQILLTSGLLFVFVLSFVIRDRTEFEWISITGNISLISCIILFVYFSLVSNAKAETTLKQNEFIWLTSNEIQIKTEGFEHLIKFNEITLLRIHYDGYRGESFPILISRGHWKSGYLNTIRIHTNLNTYTFNFILKNKMQRDVLFRYLQNFKKSGKRLVFSNEYGSNDIYKQS